MAITVAVANIKGGVGKSTTCMMLADGLACLGLKVLAVDLDPQASLTFMYRGSEHLDAIAEARPPIVTDVIFPKDLPAATPVASAITPNASRLLEVEEAGGRVDLMSAAPHMRLQEMRFEAAQILLDGDERSPGRVVAERLEERLSELSQLYHFIIFDCAPSFSALAQGALRCSDAIIMPTLADPVSAYGLAAFDHEALNETLGVPDDIPRLAVITRFVVNHVSLRIDDQLHQQYTVLTPNIRHSVNVMRASQVVNPQIVRGLRQKYDDLRGDVVKLTQSFLQNLEQQFGPEYEQAAVSR